MSAPDSRRNPRLSPLARQVTARLRERCGVQPGERLLVAVSGGADSVALLRILLEASARLRLQLEIGHFDHALRPESAQDADFVIELGRTHGLPVHMQRWESPQPGEAAARHARFAFLETTAFERGCRAVVLAQHLDDRIETVLLRLARGSGLRGWLGMAWRRPGRVVVVRPLLEVRRAALLDYLRERQQAWREDASNQDLRLARNRVRHLVLPALERGLDAGWGERWAQSLEELREAYEFLLPQVEALVARALVPEPLVGEPGHQRVAACDLIELRSAPAALLAPSLQGCIETAAPAAALGRQLSRRHLNQLSQLVRNGQNGQEVDLPAGLRAIVENGQLILVRGSEPSPTALRLECVEVTGAQARLQLEAAPPATVAAALATSAGLELDAWIALDAVRLPLEMRHLRPGDRVQLLGSPGRKEVGRILQGRRVPQRLRASWPLVEDAEGIVWIPGVGVAERARLGPESSRALHLRVRSSVPAAPEPPSESPRPGLRRSIRPT